MLLRSTSAILGITVVLSFAGAADSAEVRAIWVTRWDFQSERDVETIVHNCAGLGLNRIYFQIRGRADAFYRSRYEPWAEELGGRDPGFDPLAVAIRECRKRNIELHAWGNVMAGWKGKKLPKNRHHLVHRRPDWFLYDRFKNRHLLGDHYTILNPCLPEVRAYLAKVFADIARRYPVDGMHLDYIRFIAEGDRDRQAVPYDNRTLSDFRKLTGGFPVRHPNRWNTFRRQAIDLVVKDVSSAVRTARPGCIVSAAVLRDFSRARTNYFQDARQWRKERWVDEIVPMNYEKGTTRFRQHLQNANRDVGREAHICGVGMYLVPSANEFTRQVQTLRAERARGYAIFAYASLYPTKSHASRSGAKAVRSRRAMREALQRLNRGALARRQ
ncbi:MAG: family 10 glycosylhydrolase [Planctomycetota bacterium]